MSCVLCLVPGNYQTTRRPRLLTPPIHPRSISENSIDLILSRYLIDTPPILRGISRVALRLHQTLEERSKEQPEANQIDITHCAVFISGPDTQGVVALSRGLDEILQDKELVTDKLENLDWIRLVVNLIPPGTEEPIRYGGRNYNFSVTTEAKQFYHECVKERYEFQSELLKKGSDAFFTDENAIAILYDEKLALNFVAQQMKFGRIDLFDRIVESVRKGR